MPALNHARPARPPRWVAHRARTWSAVAACCAVLVGGAPVGTASADEVTSAGKAASTRTGSMSGLGRSMAVTKAALARADLATLQLHAATLQSEFVKASLAYETARVGAKQADALAEAKENDATRARGEAAEQRDAFAAMVVTQYQESVMSEPLVRTLVADPASTDDYLSSTVLADQVEYTEAEQVALLEVLMGRAAMLSAEAERARADAVQARREADGLLADIEAKAALVAAAANKSLTGGAANSDLMDAEQKARNDAALTAWQQHLDRVAKAKVFPYAAKAMADPRRLPRGLKPLIGTSGRPVPGVATVRFHGKPLVILPAETVAAVSRMFAEVGKPYAAYQAGPDSFDCSGLTASVWAGAGYRLADSPVGQWKKGRKVSTSDVQVGDLVFAADRGPGVHMVGTYLGGGFMLAADGVTGQVGVQEVPERLFGAVRVTLRPDGKQPNKAPAVDEAAEMRCGVATAATAPTPDGMLGYPLVEGSFRFTGTWGQPGHLWSSGYHTGLDFAAPVGTPVLASATGVVTSVGHPSWAGNLIVLDHGDGIETTYAHLAQVDVKPGQQVTAGARIGAVGELGNVTGPHLHFEVHLGGQDVDPMPFLVGPRSSPGGQGAWGGYSNGMIPAAALCALQSAAGHSLRCDAARAFDRMSAAYAKRFGGPVCITDSYRSYPAQVSLYAVKPALAAVPGTSNHGWARAVDLCGGVESFGTAQHAWLSANAARFGWTHPGWAQAAGSKPEPWHWEFGDIS